MKFFYPRFRLGHPENYLFFIIYKNIFLDQSIQKKILFNFGKTSLLVQHGSELIGHHKPSLMAGKTTHVEVWKWPPVLNTASTPARSRAAFQRQVVTENQVLGGHVQQELSGRHDFKSYAHRSFAPHLEVDLAQRYPQRARMCAPINQSSKFKF